MTTQTLEVVFQNGAFHPAGGASVPLAEGQHAKIVVEIEEKAVTTERKPFVLGLHAGMGEMSDDFDEELPNSFWLGESV